MIFQQAFINRAEIAHREVAVINKLPMHTRQHINCLLQTRIADVVALKKCMALRVKETAVEGRDLQGRVADIDKAEEFFQIAIVARTGRMGRNTLAHILLNSAGHGMQAKLFAVQIAIVNWQQITRFRVENEQQAVKQDERGIVNMLERCRVAGR